MGRKPTGSEPEAKKAFGELLQMHLDKGTRPAGHPGRDGKPWSQKEFGPEISQTADGKDPTRSVRSWLVGKHLPDLLAIERVLFGPEPPDISLDRYRDFRAELRAAHRLARNNGALDTTPQSLISDPGKCFGRSEEAKRIMAAILNPDSPGSVLLLGNGGHGKTMLSQSVGASPEAIARFGNRRWFVELEKTESAEAATSEIAVAVGLERKAKLNAVQLALTSKRGPSLLVLDNVEVPLHAEFQREGTERLLRSLLSIPDLSIIATLRSQETVSSVDWDEQLLLEPLSPGASKEMFLSIARSIDGSDADLDYFVGETGELAGIPLAVRLVAQGVFMRKSLSPLKREWEKHGTEIAMLPGGDGTRKDSLIVSIEFSLKSRRLKASGHILFGLLGQLPGGLRETDRDALVGPVGIEAAAQLRSVGLLRDSADDRISLLHPVRDLARRRHMPGPDQMAAWVVHYLDLVTSEGERLGKEVGAIALARIAPEMANVGAAMIAASSMSQTIRNKAVDALDAFGRALNYAGLTSDIALTALERACAVEGDEAGRIHCAITRGNSARRLSQNDVARDHLRRAERLLTGTDHTRLWAACYYGLGALSRVEDDHGKAKALFGDAERLYNSVGFDVGKADCLCGLAGIALTQDDFEEARKLYREAADIYKRSGEIKGEADCLSGEAESARMNDRYAIASSLYKEAAELYQCSGSRFGEADCLWGHAETARMLDNPEAALPLFQASRSLFKLTGSLIGEADCLWGLAKVEPSREKSLSFLEQARELFIGAGSLTGEADCLMAMAEASQLAQDHQAARDLYDQALKLFTKAGSVIGSAGSYFGLASVARANADNEDGRRLYERARDMFKGAGSKTGEANCLFGLAAIELLNLGSLEAERLFEQAMEIYVETGSIIGEADSKAQLADIARNRFDMERARHLYLQAAGLYRGGGSAAKADRCDYAAAQIA